MKNFLTLIQVTCILAGISLIGLDVYVTNFKYSQQVESYWNLADKSSTIEEKSKHINSFVAQFENKGLEGMHNALFFKTPDNSFDANFAALKSLQLRLEQIKTMDMSSFEYQTAIQQITQQEQGEANNMLKQLEDIWVLKYYPLIWNYLELLALGALIALYMIAKYAQRR